MFLLMIVMLYFLEYCVKRKDPKGIGFGFFGLEGVTMLRVGVGRISPHCSGFGGGMIMPQALAQARDV